MIVFKERLAGKPVRYSPSMIGGFGVEGDRYRSAAVDIETSPYKTEDLTLIPDLQFYKDTVFLQIIVDGEKGLLYFKDPNGKNHFFLSHGQEMDWLIFKRYIVEKEASGTTSNRVVYENKKFIGQLTVEFSDCPGIASKLEGLDYKLHSLEKVFKYYYECSGKKITYTIPKEKIKLKWGAVVGPSLTMVNWASPDPPSEYFGVTDFNSSFFVAGGLYLEMILPRMLGKWSWNNELFYNYYDAKGYYENIKSSNEYYKATTEIGAAYLNLNTMIRFSQPVNKISIFGNFGLPIGYMISNKNSQQVTIKKYSGEKTTDQKALPNLRKLEMGFLFGVGIRCKNLSGEFRYSISNGLSPYNEITEYVNRMYLLIGYRF